MQLHINTYGAYVHIKDQMFEIRLKKDDEIIKHHFSAKKVKSIILSESTALSSAAVKLAVTNNIDILFLENNGRPIGRVWHSKLGSTSKIRKAQLIASLDKNGLDFIKNQIVSKIESNIDFLQRIKKHRIQHHEYLDEKIKKIETLSISISLIEAESIQFVAETIRGIEGTAGRLFYETISYLLPKDNQFQTRSSRPAKDQFNAFLNYAFGVLYGKVEKSLIIAGLDPYLGYLHRDDYNQLSFVFDFIEPYRIYAIEVVFKLFSGKKINKSHTDIITNGVSLNSEGKQVLIEAFNKYMDTDTIRYRGRNQTRTNAIQFDAHTYANSLIKNKSSFENKIEL